MHNDDFVLQMNQTNYLVQWKHAELCTNMMLTIHL